MSKLTLTTSEVAEHLNTSRNLIDILRQEGAITGIKKGNGYIYPVREIERFLDRWVGLDMSNREAIRGSIAILERRKRSGV